MSELPELNIDKLADVFPEVITEARDENGKLHRAVDFGKLRVILGGGVPEGREYYAFTWAGKHEAEIEAGRPPVMVLRPCVDESVDFGGTENLYIEGDNLEALKILRKSYMHKVKMIYIDPPYNTGHDFIYNDRFRSGEADAQGQYMLFDDEGSRNFTMSNYVENSRARPRYHSDWCSMIYPRLKAARDFLSEDGVIFISIDDNEVMNLRKICDEIFGENNFIAQFVWQNKKGGGNDSIHVAVEHEYIVFYAKNHNLLGELYENYSDDYVKRYKEEDEEGRFFWDTFRRKAGKQYYPITCPDGTILEYDDDGNPISWLRSRPRFEKDLKNGEVRFMKTGEGWSVQFKQRIPQGKTPRSMLTEKGTTSTGAQDFYELFKRNIFPNPKPTELIKYLIQLTTNESSIILDFFAGSSTTAHAVLSLNSTESSHRKFIMIQLPEPCPPNSEAAKAGFSNIAQIGRERIRRAAQNLKGDTGFRTFRLDTHNLRPEVFRLPRELTHDTLDDLAENIRPGRSPLDLLFMCIADFGMPLSLPYTSEEFAGFTIHFYNGKQLAACFDPCISEELIIHLAKYRPEYAVFRDSCFRDSAAKINLGQLFRHYAPNAQVKIL